MMFTPVRYAILSPGAWGRRLLDAAARSQLLKFTGVWGRSTANRQDILNAYGGLAYDSFESLLGDPAVEAVMLPTPHFLHYPQTMAALAAGKHVFVEKPIANSVEEAEEMDRTARAGGLVLAVGLQGRRTGGARAARRMINEGRLGEVVMAVAIQCAPLAHFHAYKEGDWEVDPEKNPGGPLDNLGVHYMDLMQYLLGPVARVSGSVASSFTSFATPDAGTVNLTFQSGALGVYATNQLSPYVSRMTLHGTKGSLHFNRFGQELAFEDIIGIREAQQGKTAVTPIEIEGPNPYTTALQEELEDFAMCIRHGGTPEVGAREGILSLRVVRAALESHRTGRTVELKSG